MKGAIETMLGVVMMTLMACLAALYITASLNTEKAQNYHAAVITEMEASDFADSVIANCKTKAIENGYRNLNIDKRSTLNGSPYAKVVLTYDYRIPLIHLTLEHTIEGYAK